MNRWIAPALVVLLAGCAQSPGGGASRSTRITFRATVDGEINRNFVYIVALRASTQANPTTQGPIPVIQAPWGNGFVAGNANLFVQYDPTVSPNYGVFRFRNTALTEWFQVGIPVLSTDVPDRGRTLEFTLDLNQLVANPSDAAALQSLQVNLLTMDRIPRGNDTRRKEFDGLGNSRLPSEVNEFVTVSLRASRTYDNVFFGNLEPRGDVADPDLDLVDFSIRVELP